MNNTFNIEATGRELILREGKAPDVPAAIQQKYSTTLQGIVDWLKYHGTGQDAVVHIDPLGHKSVLHDYFGGTEAQAQISRKEGELVADMQITNGGWGTARHVLEAEVAKNKELAALNIYTGGSITHYTVSQMQQHLKLARMFFADKDEHTRVLAALQGWRAKQTITVEQDKNDRTGSKRNLVDARNDMPQLEFVVRSQLYTHEPERTFRVEVCGDMTDGSARLWLESLELRELLAEGLQGMFDRFAEQLAALDPKPLVLYAS